MAETYTDKRFDNVDGVIRRLIDEVTAVQRELAANRQTTAQALAAIMARIEHLEAQRQTPNREHPAVMAEAIDALNNTCEHLAAGLKQAHRNNTRALESAQQHNANIKLITDTQMHSTRSIDVLWRRLEALEQRK